MSARPIPVFSRPGGEERPRSGTGSDAGADAAIRFEKGAASYRPGRDRRPAIALYVGLLVYAVATLFVADSYYQLMLTLVPVWAAVGVAWNVFSGYSGLVSFGHAAFFGLGAFTVTLLFVDLGITPWFGIVAAGCVGALAGALIGLPTFRLRGHYFALAMLAYPLALLYIFEWLGFREVTLPMQREAPAMYMQFADPRAYTLLAVALLAVALSVDLAVARSRFGLSLLAIKQNELAAQGAGVDPFRWKLKALVLSGAIAGAIGGFYAVVLLVVTPGSVFGMLASAQAMIVALFGGAGTPAGPLIGALLLIPLGETLHAELGSRLPGIQGVVFGVAIILVVLLAPEGVLPRLVDLWRRRHPPAPVPPMIVDTAPFRRGSAECSVPGEVVLQVRGLGRDFGGLVALDGVEFEVQRGEILGIIGPNGAGKTTLFNVMNGYLPPSRGKVVFEGRRLDGMKPHHVCRAGVGRTFQVARPFPRLSTIENVVVGAFVHSPDEAQAYARAAASLARVGLSAHAGVAAASLSTLQLRLMELARAVAGSPRLLLLDEILAGLGAEECEHVLKTIDSLRRDGITVVVIEHTMHAMVRLADRLLVLDHGRPLACGEPGAVTSDPAVIEAYLGKRWLRHAGA